MMAPPVSLPGLDLDRLHEWLVKAMPGVRTDLLRADVIAGGRSNLTYRLRAGEHMWILRRPPLGHVLATAHDMTREYRVMRALAGSAVPVPEVLASCDDPDVLGAPFYIMSYLEGSTYQRAYELSRLGSERVRRPSEGFVDVLADLHSIDYRDAGLQDFGRPEGYLGRQVSRWSKQMSASRSRDLPDADRLAAKLAEHIPSGGAIGIVHGDYRLDNVIVDETDRAVGVIDWEMSTIGDLASDLGLTIVYMRLAQMVGEARAVVVADASAAEGFLSEDEVLEQYARRTGSDLEDFGFYIGLASYKLAGILEGIHYRYLQGQTVGSGFDTIGELVEPLLAAGMKSMKGVH